MGSYAHANIGINVNAVDRANKKYGLPTVVPDINAGFGYYLDYRAVKTWCDAMNEMQLDNEAFLVSLIVREQASEYIYKKSAEADEKFKDNPKARRAFLRKASKQFRVFFC